MDQCIAVSKIHEVQCELDAGHPIPWVPHSARVDDTTSTAWVALEERHA